MMGSEYRNSYRIIAGEWRGRRLDFPPLEGLRPTPDRVRETLFNWLQPLLPGAICLDLFAGSGALGFEALSRGAAEITLVDSQRDCCSALQRSSQRLEVAARCKIVHGDGLQFLARQRDAFDIIFLDPPYQAGLLQPALVTITEKSLLRSGGRIYLETRAGQQPSLPDGWALLRSKQAGNVGYHLAAAKDDGVS